MDEITFYNKPLTIVLGLKQGFCNLACSYCYLTHSNRIYTISPAVVERVAQYIRNEKRTVRVLLHGGEPMLGSLEETKQILAPLLECHRNNQIKFSIQTNGTLITQAWCEFFREFDFAVGVSLDGPRSANKQRVDHAGKEAYDKILSGISLLRANNLKFHIISVINKIGLGRAEELYYFFRDEIRPTTWCINLEEVEGVNMGTDQYNSDYAVTYSFWYRLFEVWYNDEPRKRMPIRELNSVINYIDRVLAGIPPQSTYYMYTTVDFQGNVYVYDPELAGITAPQYNNFVVGNILSKPLSEILDQVSEHKYVQEYRSGVHKCRATCSTFEFCQSRAVLSNKFVQSSIDGTETPHCRMIKKELLSAVSNAIRENAI